MKNIYSLLIGILLSLYGFNAIAQPSITTYDPAQNATDVAVDKTLVLTFDEDIEFNDDGDRYYVEIYDGNDNFIIDYQIRSGAADTELSISGTQLSINPGFDLDGNTTYYVLIDADALWAVSDGSGFTGISSSTQWRFTTASPSLYITDYNPLQDATNTPINQTLTLTFNSNIKFNASSTRYYIEIYDASNNLFADYEIRYGAADSEVTISGDQLSIAPATNFTGNTTYYVLIDANGIQSDPDEVNFAGISSDTEWRFTTSSSAPSVTDYDPSKNSTTTLIDQNLTLTFDEDIAFNSSSTRYYIEIFKSDGTTVEDWQIRSGAADSGISISGNQLIIDPSVDLDYNTSFYVIVDADGLVSSSTGVGFSGLLSDTDWPFTTVIEEIPTLTPADRATGVTRTPNMSATFSDDITFEDNTSIQIYKAEDPTNDPVIINTGTAPTYGDRDSRLTISGATFSVDLSNTLLAGDTTYIVYIPEDKLSVNTIYYNGFSDVNNPGWSFTTALNPPEPIVQTYDPIQNATSVSIKKTLTLTFDRDIQANSTTTTTYIKLFKTGNATPILQCQIDNSTIEPDKGVSISGNVLTIDPTSDLDIDSDYYITIDAGAVESTFGAPFAGIDNSSTIWSFHTEVPPAITAFDPLNDATEIAIDKSISITFDKDIAANSTSNFYYIRIFDSADNTTPVIEITSRTDAFTSDEATINVSGNIITIDPNSDFSASKTYYMTIDYGAIEGVDGTVFGGIDNSTTNHYQFSTVTNPPAVVTYDPVQDAIEVPVDKVLTITFDKDIQVNSGTSNKYLYLYEDGNSSYIYQYTFQGGSISPSGDISISGTTMTLDFPDNFDLNTNYYIVIDAGAIEAATTGDPFGGIDNSIANNWRFKTIAPPEWIVDYPRIENQNESSLDLLGQTQKDGNYYFVVTKSTTAPTEAQIVAGQDENGDAATLTGNSTMTADVVFTSTLDITTLDVSVSHYIYIVSQETAYNLYSEISQIEFIRNVVSTWTGAADNVFNNLNNWSGNSYTTYGSIYVPSGSDNYPLMSGTIKIYNVEVEAGAELTIDENSTITATGDLDLYSSTTQNASLLNNGTLIIEGETRVHQIVTTSTQSYYICSAVSGTTQNSIGADQGMYYWDNPTNNWAVTSPTASMTTAGGYVIRSSNSELLFSGELNNGAISVGVLRQNDDDGQGWNLVGNPYPSSVDWALSGFTKENIFDGFWIFLNDQSLYGAYNQASGTAVNITNSRIPSNHAFWVRVEKGFTTGQLQFTNPVRVHNDTSYLKSATLSTIPTLKLVGVNGDFRDQIAVVFNDEATVDLDDFDSDKKFSSSNNYIQFFTTVESKDLCITGYPMYTSDFTVPLGFRVNQAGTYTIERVDYSNFPEGSTVILEDLLDDKIVDLVADGSYTFSTSATGDITDRFLLTFKNDYATAISSDKNTQKSRIYSYDNFIVIKTPELKDAKYLIYSVNGQVIKGGKLESNTTTTINIDKTGIYVVKVVSSNGVESQKVILN